MKSLNYHEYLLSYKKIEQLPETLIYKSLKNGYSTKNTNTFVIFSTKNPDIKTTMVCRKNLICRDNKKNIPSLYIAKLISNPMQNGLGRKMLNFAKLHSKRCGCNGFFHLDADVGFQPNHIPHIFYRKMGMNTKDALINAKLDRWIKKRKNATYKDFPNIKMYYPPVETTNKNNWKVFLTKLFTKLGI